MTYCVAMRLDAGPVFLSASRLNAGFKHLRARRGERLRRAFSELPAPDRASL